MTLRRALQHQLQSWQAAGLTHLPRTRLAATGGEPPPAAALAPNAPVAQAPPPLPQPAAPPVVVSVVESSTGPARPVTPAANEPPRAEPAVVAAAPPTAGRAAQLQVLSHQVAACTRCPELASTRRQTVFGVGDPAARIVFIGEAPGADEDAQGEPFVGKAGQLLNKIIEASQLQRDKLYICNILKCRPPGNRTPAPPECANCREYLDGQLAIIDPDYIVCWGTVAAQNLLGSTVSIGQLRRKFFRHGRARVLCTYHPSYLLRNPAAKKDVWEDMQLFMADMGIDLKTPKP